MKQIAVIKNMTRIDQYLMEELGISRSKVQKMIQKKLVLLNGKTVKNSTSIKIGDQLEVEELKEEPFSLSPEDIPLDIVYEDNDIMVINKRNGMVVHPAVGNPNGTLVNALLFHSQTLSDKNGEFRPGIVHRIDAFTTGLLVVAKNNKAHEYLAKQLEEKNTHRKYIALVWGVISHDTGTIDAPIGRDKIDRKKMAVTSTGKKSVTHFKILERLREVTLIELQLETGRTHQIRVHMNYIGHPIVNDPVYGNRPILDGSGQCLHAKELGFYHPSTHEYMGFDSEIPSCFIRIMEQFKDS